MHTANVLSTDDFDKLPDPSTKLQAWHETQAMLAYLVNVERHMRTAAFDLYFPGYREAGESGLKNYDLGGGYVLKGTPAVNYKLDKDAIDDTLAKIAKLGAEGALLADRLVTFKPDLSVTEYKKLDPSASRQQAKAKDLIDGVITITPGLPKLELVSPQRATG